MGAWGTGIFDDDAAYDWTEELQREPLTFMRRAFETALRQDYVGIDESHAVTVAAAHMDAILHRTPYRHDDQDAFDAWLAVHATLAVGDLKKLAVEALDQLLNGSELDDEWSGAPQYAEWRRTLTTLRSRLASGI